MIIYVFEKTIEEIETLSKQSQPFVVTMLTTATHGPDAFLDAHCVKDPTKASAIPKAIECTAQHVSRLIDKLDELNLLDDTIVVIQSDHLAKSNSLSKAFTRFRKQNKKTRRSNLFVILGTPMSRQINKVSTQFDVYPTILEALGYKLKDNAANLGRSLLSDKKTLAQKLTVPTLSDGILNNWDLQKLIWLEDNS